MTSPLIENAKALARRTLTKHGKPANVVWPGSGASLVADEDETSAAAKIVTGKRDTQILNGVFVVLTHAIMSPVGRNPAGAKVAVGNQTYTVLSSEDVGDVPDDVAAHRLVLR